MITFTRLSYGQALELLEDNKRVQREGWSGTETYLFLVKGEAVEQAICNCYGNFGHDSLQVLDAIYMKTKDNKLVPWMAAHADILAKDWQIK